MSYSVTVTHVAIANTVAEAIALMTAGTQTPPPGFTIECASTYSQGRHVSLLDTSAASTLVDQVGKQADTTPAAEPRKPRAAAKKTEAVVADPKPEAASDSSASAAQTAEAQSPVETAATASATTSRTDGATHDEARAIASTKMKALSTNREAIQALIKGCGVEALGKIEPSKLAGFIAELNKLPEAA